MQHSLTFVIVTSSNNKGNNMVSWLGNGTNNYPEKWVHVLFLMLIIVIHKIESAFGVWGEAGS